MHLPVTITCLSVLVMFACDDMFNCDDNLFTCHDKVFTFDDNVLTCVHVMTCLIVKTRIPVMMSSMAPSFPS